MLDNIIIKAIMWSALGILVLIAVTWFWSLFIYMTSKFWHKAKDDSKNESFMKVTKKILAEKERTKCKDEMKQ